MINKLDYNRLSKSFNDKSKPYRYVVIDNFFEKSLIDKLYNEYPSGDNKDWYKSRDDIHGTKNVLEQGLWALSKKEHIPDLWLNVLLKLNSLEFCRLLERLTGISDLLPDDYNETGQWSGLRVMKKGSYQLIHSDSRVHPHLNLEKKLTIVGYLNKNWMEEDSGCLEIWNSDMTKCVKKVEPLFNRVILFENTETSYHGVPKVNNYRRSFLASYLKDEKDFKETRSKALFVKRPNEPDKKLIDEISKLRANLTDY